MEKIKLSENILNEAREYKEKCIGCNKCTKGCPLASEIKTSPKEILESITKEQSIEAKIPYSCTLCNNCTKECPVGVDFSKLYSEIRNDTFENNSSLVKNFGYKTIRFHQKNSFSKIFTGNNLTGNKTVFFPGCSLSGYSSDIVDKTYEYLKLKLDNVGILSICCGKPSLDIGDKKHFEDKFKDVLKLLEENKVEEIIVACSNCYNILKEYTNIKVISLWEVLIDIGIPKSVKGLYRNKLIDVALHDPCPIRSEKQIHESVRKILNELGVYFKEFPKNKEKTECCGAGGMMMSTNKNVALTQMKKRANQVDSSCIISYCESCVNSMIVGEKKSLHILDLLFNKDVINKGENTQSARSTVSHWIQRRKTALNAKR